MYLKGSQVFFSKLLIMISFVPEGYLILEKSADPFYLGLHCLQEYPFRGSQYTNSLRSR